MRALVFQHIAAEHPGIFRSLLAHDQISWDTVELDTGDAIPPLEPYDLLLVFGGPMDVWEEAEHPWLIAEKAAINRWVTELKRPYLGICLGHQLLAAATGGSVEKMSSPEVGLCEIEMTPAGQRDPLLANLPTTLSALNWHGAAIQSPPAGSEILAGNLACAIQAIRVGQHAYGIQFHVELEAGTVGEWQKIPEYQCSLTSALGPDGAQELSRAAAAQMPALNATAHQIYRNLITIVAAWRQTRVNE